MNIVLFGPPGAGKGTQADNIVKNFQLYKISTGDLLRDEIKKKSTLGREIKKLIDQGFFVSDKIISSLITNILKNKKYFNSVIFDGYPRNLNQAKELENLLKNYNQKLSCVLSLKVDKDVLFKRVLGRQNCSKCGLIFNEFFNPATKENHTCGDVNLIKRADDNKKTIEKRFGKYSKETLPVLEFYKEQSLLREVNGNGKIDDIYKEIKGIIASLETWL